MFRFVSLSIYSSIGSYHMKINTISMYHDGYDGAMQYALRSKVFEWFQCLAVRFRPIFEQSENEEGRKEIIMLVPICKVNTSTFFLYMLVPTSGWLFVYSMHLWLWIAAISILFTWIAGFATDILHLRILCSDGIMHTKYVVLCMRDMVWNVEYKVMRCC